MTTLKAAPDFVSVRGIDRKCTDVGSGDEEEVPCGTLGKNVIFNWSPEGFRATIDLDCIATEKDEAGYDDTET